jgi:glucan-binding YG repeat protein
VETIGNNAFQYCVSLTYVTIPDSVETIGQYAFTSCASLESITIPKNVTTIARTPFSRCGSLKTILVDAANNNFIAEGGVLFNKDKTTLIAYPAGKTGTTYAVPEGVTTIVNSTFEGCTSLESITIPASVTTIGQSAFDDCSSLESIIVDAGNNYFISADDVLFNKAKTTLIACPPGKAGDYIVPDGVTSIETFAFRSCAALKSVTIPGSVTVIAYQSFLSAGLTSLTLEEGTTTIQDNAFEGCASLTSVTVPASVTYVGGNAFKDCNLTDVTLLIKSLVNWSSTAFNSSESPVNIWYYTGALAPDKTFSGTKQKIIMIKDIALEDEDGSPVSDISLDATDNDNKAAELSITYDPEVNGEIGQYAPTEIIWSSSNEAVATVTEDPEDATKSSIAALADGTALIIATVKTHSGEKKASVPVTVATANSQGQTYALTVDPSGSAAIVGTGVGVGNNEFELEAKVTITADDVDSSGKVFGGWTDGGDGTFESASSSTTVFTMPASSATVTATYKTKYATPTAAVNYATETLEGLVTGTYSFNGEDGVSIEGTTYDIHDNWMTASALSIVRKADGNYADSDAQSLTIKARPAAPAVQGLNETVPGGNNGKITGVTTAMQYKLTTASEWTDVTDSLLTGDALTDLAPGSYEVRLKAKSYSFASAVKTVTIAAYLPSSPTTYAVTVTGGTGGGSYAEHATVTITANAAAEGKVFDKWTSSDGVIFADASKVTTSFTMPTKAVTVTATYADDSQGTGGDPENPVTDGWVYEDGAWKYFIDSVAQTGWVYDQSTWYYLNSDGEMQTGWLYDGNYKAWFYLSGNGAMKTGWVKYDGNWYYLRGDGKMVAGKWLHDTDGSWYYLSGNGKMLTGKQAIGGKAYRFKSNGAWIG